jgi:hypothetical protein
MQRRELRRLDVDRDSKPQGRSSSHAIELMRHPFQAAAVDDIETEALGDSAKSLLCSGTYVR